MDKIRRRDFLKKAALAAAGGALVSSCGSTERDDTGSTAVHTEKRFRWKMVTTWPPKFPVLGVGAELFAQWVEEMSGGRMKIRVYGGGELVPALETFDAVSQGNAEMGHAASYYWAGKAPASQFFCAVPFGMNAQQMNAWLISGGGLQLWETLYAQFNLIPIPCGNTGVQMGGWFKKKLNSSADLRGLKMRMPGLGGRVITQSGGSAVLSDASEIFTNLERGVIDATEWIGPYHDYIMGFPKIAPYYYYPGWHEPGAVLELMINKQAFEGLPSDLQAIIRSAAYRCNTWVLSEFESQNVVYLERIRREHGTEVLPFPDEVLRVFRKNSAEVIAAVTDGDPMSARVYQSFLKFKKTIGGWAEITEKAYYLNLQQDR